MAKDKGLSGWFRQVFGGAEPTASAEPSKESPEARPLPKDAPMPAPITPADVFHASADGPDHSDDDLESMTIIPGPDSDALDMLEALREEMQQEAASQSKETETK